MLSLCDWYAIAMWLVCYRYVIAAVAVGHCFVGAVLFFRNVSIATAMRISMPPLMVAMPQGSPSSITPTTMAVSG